MQGTDYYLRISASTRGGQGRWSPPISFRTHGEARIIDMEAFLTTGISTSPALLSPGPELSEGDAFSDPDEVDDTGMMNPRTEYKVPDKVGRIFVLYL